MSRHVALCLIVAGFMTGCAPRETSVTIVSVRLVPFIIPQGALPARRTQMVLVDWTNTGNTPVRAVEANITLRGASGNALRDPFRGNTTTNMCIYAIGDDNPGVSPGTTYQEPEGEGFVIIPGLPGMQDDTLRATSATVTITKVSEKSGMTGT